jgi:hypothetical protein
VSIEVLSIEVDGNIAYVIATNLQLEVLSVTRAKDGRKVAKNNALVDLSLTEYPLPLIPMKNAGGVLTH